MFLKQKTIFRLILLLCVVAMDVFLVSNHVATYTALPFNFNESQVHASTSLPDIQSVSTLEKTEFVEMVFDSTGARYSSGIFSDSLDFNAAGTSDVKTSLGGYDSFITKHNADGSYAWTKTWGGTGEDIVNGIVIDSAANVYITGYFQGTADFDPDVTTDDKTSNGDYDVFVTKLASDGTYAWTKTWGGINGDIAHAISVDALGNYYITGVFKDTVDFDPEGAGDAHVSNGNSDAFLSKYNSNGTYAWTKTWGGAGVDRPYDLTIYADGIIYLSGFFQVTADFDPEGTTENHTSNGGFDVFFMKFSTDGSYVWTKTWGGIANDAGYSIATDSSGAIYIAGGFNSSTDFDPTGDIDTHVPSGDSDMFVSKYNSSGTYLWTKTVGGTGYDENYWQTALYIDSQDQVYMTGVYSGTVDFDPGVGTSSFTAVGSTDAFLLRLNTDGEFVWVKSFGGSNYDDGMGIVANGSDLYAYGYFYTSAEFNSGGTSLAKTAITWAGYVAKFTYPQAPTVTISSPSFGSTSAPTVPSCSFSEPSSAPHLFQINAKSDTVTLYFSPLTHNVTEYQISYGYGDGIERFGTTVQYGPSSGVLSYSLNALNPRSTYFFKIRAANNCKTGAWSNSMTIRTDSRWASGKLLYFATAAKPIRSR